MLKTVSSVANALGALNYKGTWNATTNTPALASGVGTQGDYYVVSVAGTTNLDGITNWGVGDWAAFNGSVWQRVEGGADGNFDNLTALGTSTLTGNVQIVTGDLTVSAGNVVIGTSGKGIDFSATAGTGTSELLDDYEEGTWTPVIADSNNGGNAGTSASAQGEYTKVGNVVYAKCLLSNIDTTGLTATEDLFVQGLPFTSANTAVSSHDIGSCAISRVTFQGFVSCGVPDNSSSVRFLESVTGVSYNNLNVSEFSSTAADIYFSVVYFAA